MKNSKLLIWLLGCFMSLILAVPVGAAAGEGGQTFSREELAQMLAPVALYPDALLSQVLMAATYPLEVVEADRWLKKNSLLKGDNLDEALRDHDWDASVKSLCHVPAILALMSERLDETTRLGDAFLAQEKEVMDTIQELRSRAMREGNLKSDDKQKVSVRDDGTIVIEPAAPETVYVPYYNTRYVYGPWWYPAWPPWYWGPGEVVVGAGIYFWPDFFFGFGYWSYFDWPGRTIIIDVSHRPHFFHHDYDWDSHRGGWRHESAHRHGVDYRDRDTAERFAQPPERVRRAEQQATRDRVVRGPVTAGSGSAVKAEGRDKTGTTGGTPERRAPGSSKSPAARDKVGGPAGGRSDIGGDSGRRNRDVEVSHRDEKARPVVESSPRVERSPGVERSPRVESSPRVERSPRVEPLPRAEQAPRVEPAPRVESSPRMEPSPRAGREDRGVDSAVSREGSRTRESATDNDNEIRGVRESGNERRGGSGREWGGRR